MEVIIVPCDGLRDNERCYLLCKMPGLIFIKNLAHGGTSRLRREVTKQVEREGLCLLLWTEGSRDRSFSDLDAHMSHRWGGGVSLDAEPGSGDLGQAKVTSPGWAGPEGLHL